jgi:hypothetical protein
LNRTKDRAEEIAETAERDLETREIESAGETPDLDQEIEETEEIEIVLAEDLLPLRMELVSGPIQAGVLEKDDHQILMFALPME